MKKLLIGLALGSALSAYAASWFVKSKEPAAPATTNATTPAADAAATTPVADVAVDLVATGDAATAFTMPSICEAYFRRAEACVAKAGDIMELDVAMKDADGNPTR